MAHEYDDAFVAGLEWMWGEGFLSPGGAEEVSRILRGVDLPGKQVLDIGCGIGGIDVLLVKQYKAAHVVAVDVEPALLEKARQIAQRATVAEQIDFHLVEPGPLPFPDAAFDVVFSKDAMIHIPDKKAIYGEIYRILKPGGRLVSGDWFGSDEAETQAFRDWLAVVGLSFRMGTITTACDLLREIGFIDIENEDRTTWYQQEAKREMETISGDNYSSLVAHIGEQAAAQRRRSSAAKLAVVEQGQLRPGHIRARRPFP